MAWASEAADAKTWTCEIRTKAGKLPDRTALTKHLEETMRVGAHLYGVEAVVIGRLAQREGELRLELDKTKESVRLGALQRKVQWDVANKREAELTEEEKTAFSRLQALAVKMEKRLLRVTGPLLQEKAANEPLLQVRAFEENRTAPKSRPSVPSPARKHAEKRPPGRSR